jgi:hypothetical protein
MYSKVSWLVSEIKTNINLNFRGTRQTIKSKRPLWGIIQLYPHWLPWFDEIKKN